MELDVSEEKGRRTPAVPGPLFAMFTIPFFLYLLALILAIGSAVSPRIPLWIAVLLIAVGLLVASAH